LDFIERTLRGLVENTEHAIFAEELARADGLLQKIDPRVKIIGLLMLILDTTLARNFLTILLILALGILLAVLSKIPISTLAKRAWLSAFFFTGTIALPVIFITEGDVLVKIPLVNLAITWQGLKSAAFLLLRVETAVTLSFLLILTTLWTHVLKALRILRVPVVFVVILGMTYRYIFVMLETAQNIFEARQSRMVGKLSGRESRKLIASSVGVLLTKSYYLNSEIYQAMQSRGFRGEVYTLDDFAMKKRDWLALVAFFLAAVLFFVLGH
jgi:cobalt/nickel transport system permease protein